MPRANTQPSRRYCPSSSSVKPSRTVSSLVLTDWCPCFSLRRLCAKPEGETMASDYTVGDLVAEFLTACGVTTAFGIASVHNIPMLDAIGRRNTIRFMMARGELGGAHMADGYARVSGSLGVLFSSTGPGAANAIGGLIEARFSG